MFCRCLGCLLCVERSGSWCNRSSKWALSTSIWVYGLACEWRSSSFGEIIVSFDIISVLTAKSPTVHFAGFPPCFSPLVHAIRFCGRNKSMFVWETTAAAAAGFPNITTEFFQEGSWWFNLTHLYICIIFIVPISCTQDSLLYLR